jgi:hypothetical protein
MTNYDENDQDTVADFVFKNLPRHKQLALATVGEDGKPWVVCVNLAFDGRINFIWRSLMASEHSKNVNARPEVSICVFSETAEVGDFGFYCNATAHEVNDEAELIRLLTVRYSGREIPPVSDFLGDSPGRIYYARVGEAWVNDDRHKKTKLDLEVLRRKARQYAQSRQS